MQKPLLGFQHAKLAFEAALIGSDLTFSIVRPTAFFKSLSGQIERSADYLADSLEDDHRWNRVLPIGGLGEAIMPRQQGEPLARALRGVLVSQDQDDEPASVLLDRIRARAAAPKPKRGRGADVTSA